MNTEQLKAFLQVAKEGRLTVAAKRLGVSQPGLSRQLQTLETELGVRLLVRTPGGAVLTDAGERFLPHARRALDALAAGIVELGELTTTPRGTVSLGTLRTVGTYLLPDLVRAFKARYPEVLPRLSEGTREGLEDAVSGGELDLCIVSLPLRRLDLMAQKLWEEELVLVMPRGHRLTKPRRPVALEEVAEEPLVVIPGMSGTSALEAACEARGVKPRVAVEVDNAEGVRRMVERGLGVALLPALMAKDPGSKGIEVVDVAKGGPRRQIALVHRGDDYLTAAARALKGFIVESLRRQGP